MAPPNKCDLCGRHSAQVSPAVALDRHGHYHALHRCVGHRACRARVETTGKPWPLADREPADATRGGD